MKCSLPVKNTQNFVSALHIIAISKKPSPLVYFVYSFSIVWIFGIINQIIQKDSSKNEVYKF